MKKKKKKNRKKTVWLPLINNVLMNNGMNIEINK